MDNVAPFGAQVYDGQPLTNFRRISMEVKCEWCFHRKSMYLELINREILVRATK